MDTIVGKKVLIVEDEYFLAMDLARHFETLGVEVVGPVPDVKRAESLVPFADAAILDINLNGEFVFPLADELAREGKPFVFVSGYDDIVVPERFRGVSLFSKPSSWRQMPSGFRREFLTGAIGNGDDVFLLLPALRLEARLMILEENAADRLVERTLEQAVKGVDRQPEGQNLITWLHGIMMEIARSAGHTVLN